MNLGATRTAINRPSRNLARFAETLLQIVHPNPERAVELASEAISAFTCRYQEHWLAGMREKLGISGNKDSDLDLVRDLLQAMHENAADFTLTFRRLCAAAADETADAEPRACSRTQAPTTVGPPGGARALPLTGGNPTNAPRRCET
jgi:uncharacterized protein YdiU (UPF0061 family)